MNKNFIKLKEDKLMCYILKLGNSSQLFLNIASDELNALNDVSAIYIYISKDLSTYYIGKTNEISRRHNEHSKEKEKDTNDLKYYSKFSGGTLVVFYGYKVMGNLDYIERSLIKLFREWGNLYNFKLLNERDGNKSDLCQIDRENIDLEVVKAILETLKKNLLLNFPIHTKKDGLQSILFRHSPFFELSEQQKKVFNDVLIGKEHIYIVRGGAGTGKTVLLTHLIAKLLGGNIEHKLKGEPLKRIAVCLKTNIKDQIKKIFKSIVEKLDEYELYIDTWQKIIEEGEKTPFDYIFVDESQRLLKYHSNIFPRSQEVFLKERGKENVLNLLIGITDKIILFYDEKQSIRPTDINKIDDDKDYLKEYNFSNKKVYNVVLNMQYRIKVNSYSIDLANNYINYIKFMLGISNEKPDSSEFLKYDYFKIYDEMAEVDKYIFDKKQKFPFKNSKIVAGYTRPNNRKCEKKNKKAWHEIDKIWNRDYKKWAITNNNEVGAIHSVQGYEFDYIGVIIGNDIEYKNGQMQINKKNYYDQNGKSGIEEDKVLLEYVKNIYYTLLTRGVYGIRIFIEDEGLRNYWKKETEKLVNGNDKNNLL